jgi:hypothetical protein
MDHCDSFREYWLRPLGFSIGSNTFVPLDCGTALFSWVLIASIACLQQNFCKQFQELIRAGRIAHMRKVVSVGVRLAGATFTRQLGKRLGVLK